MNCLIAELIEDGFGEFKFFRCIVAQDPKTEGDFPSGYCLVDANLVPMFV